MQNLKLKFLFLMLSLVLIQFTQAAERLDIKHYNLNLNITNLKPKSISGFAIIEAYILENNTSFIEFDLLKLSVNSVSINSVQLNFTKNDSVLIVQLPNNRQKGDSIAIKIEYEGQPIADAKWGGFYFTGNYSFNMGVGFASSPHNFGRCWFPCNDDFKDRATYEYHIETDSGFAAICGGKFLGQIGNTWNWKINQAIPSYLASVAVGKYVMVTDVFNSGSKSIPMILASEAKDTANFKASFVRLKQAITCFEQSFGPYLFDRVGFVGVPFNSGAMEHAANIAYPLYAINGNTDYETLMAHELSHHWWGNLATCRTAPDMWLNEGWASFCEALFLECLYGKEKYNEDIKDKTFEVFRWAHVRDEAYRAVSGVPHDFTYGTHVYTKGALMVNTLRTVLGDEAFFNACKAYLTKNSFQDVSSASLLSEFQKFTTINLTSFFDHWIYNAGNTNVYLNKWKFTLGNAHNLLEVSFREHVKISKSLYTPLPLVYRVFDKNGKSLDFPFSLNAEILDTFFMTPFDFIPEYGIINPDNKIALAKTYEHQVIKGTGVKQLPNALLTITVQNNPDSFTILAENYFTGVNPNEFAVKGLRFSPDRIWKIDGSFPPTFKATAFFNYDGSSPSSKNGGGLDNELLKIDENGLVLLYRSRPDTAWIIETELTWQSGSSLTDKTGRFWVNNLKKGEYAFGRQETGAGFKESNKKKAELKVFPNPNNGKFNIEFPENHSNGSLCVYDKNGILIQKELIKASTKLYEGQMKNPVSATYFVVFEDESGSLNAQLVVQ
jgi:aminopeptidase N